VHIVHVGIGYERQTLDGATRAVSVHARAQHALGHQVTMVAPTRGPWAESESDGIRTIELPVASWPRLGATASQFFATNALAADVYHFHTSYVRSCLAARPLGVPYVVSTHGAYMPLFLASRRLWNHAFRLLIGRHHLRSAAFVHAITEPERAADARYAPGARLRVIPNSLDETIGFDAAARAATRSRLGLGPDDLLVLYMGRYDIEGKGLDDLIASFTQASRRTPRRLALVLHGGPERDRRALERMVPADLRDRVAISGPVLGDERTAVLSAADLFATLSRGDVMPTAVLDALSHGLPLLVTEQTGYGDFVMASGQGRVVSHEQAEVAEAMLSFQPRNEPAAREATRAAALFSFEPLAIADRFVELYREALAP
jgi:glycosyltransferase involved in cell wall biosynthesis